MQEYTYKFNNKKHHARFIKTFEQSAHIFNNYNSIIIMDDFTVKIKDELLFRIIFEATFGLQGIKITFFNRQVNLLGRKELI